MTSTVWRLAHLTLAVFSFAFLLIASITGVILAIDAVNEKMPPYKVAGFNEITLAQSLPALREVYPEALELSVDHNQFVTLEGFNEEGDDFKSVIHPITGQVLGEPLVKSNFIQWITSLHRSLFLHETGRFIVGFVSFLLLLITISGTILIIKRQQGVKHFFSKVNKDFFAQYGHVVTGRLMLLPILIISLTGTYLFLLRFDVISKPITEPNEIENAEGKQIPLNDFPIFNQIHLADVSKVEFPFGEDADEFFKIKLKDKEIVVNQLTGKVLAEEVYPTSAVLETLSLDLHTGRTNVFWAIILAVASVNILFFIYSGFVITFKRKAVKIKNKFKADEAEIILLVGSENGSTLHFANKIHQQLLAVNTKSFITTLNQYRAFSQAKQLVIFTSTYGLGDAPSNAHQFEKLIQKYIQSRFLKFSVVGFGSKNYKDYCAFAAHIDQLLGAQNCFERLLPLYTVNDRSTHEFTQWVQEWNKQTKLSLATTPALYSPKQPNLSKLKVVNKTNLNTNDNVFKLTLKGSGRFQSGDLLAVYPANDERERLYSIAKINGNIQLVVKLHESGLGSTYLYQQIPENFIRGRIVQNASFHLPKRAKTVVMIANGTGIAPFLGMISENTSKKNLHLYCGFRYNNETAASYQNFANQYIENGQLKQYSSAFSRETERQYVMNLIERDQNLFVEIFKTGGVIMICGSLAMQKDVEAILEHICHQQLSQPLSYFKQTNQLLTDCY